MMPTLLTKMSTRPKCATAAATTRRQSASEVTSAGKTSDSPPSASIISLVRTAHGSLASISTTRAPARANRIEAARPLPIPSARDPAPVTMATLGASRMLP
jgi:hypothetical protein